MGVERNESFGDQTAAGIKGRRGGRAAEPAQSRSRLGESGWPQRGRAGYTACSRGGKALGWVAASCPVHLPAQRAGPPRHQASGEEAGKVPGLLTHHLQPLSRARSKSQDFGPGHCGRGRADSRWGTPALPRAIPQPLPVSEAAGERTVEPQSALSCRGWSSGSFFQKNPPSSSLNVGPVVASEENSARPGLSAPRHSADAQRPHRGEKALYFPAGRGVAGHPGTCSLRWSKEPVRGRDLKRPGIDFRELACTGTRAWSGWDYERWKEEKQMRKI